MENKVTIYIASRIGFENRFTHALKIPRNNASSLCGIIPSSKSNSWRESNIDEVTCPLCLRKIKTLSGKKIEYTCNESYIVGFDNE